MYFIFFFLDFFLIGHRTNVTIHTNASNWIVLHTKLSLSLFSVEFPICVVAPIAKSKPPEKCPVAGAISEWLWWFWEGKLTALVYLRWTVVTKQGTTWTSVSHNLWYLRVSGSRGWLCVDRMEGIIAVKAPLLDLMYGSWPPSWLVT